LWGRKVHAQIHLRCFEVYGKFEFNFLSEPE
jgi:hypothetical protein